MDEFELNINKYRKDTPGVKNVIHLNNAGASLVPSSVLQKIIDYLNLEAEIGGYEAAAKAKNEISDVYQQIADLINASAEEIAYVDSASRAWTTILYSFPFDPGDRILISEIEFGSNVVSLAQIAQRKGVSIDVIRNDKDGKFSLNNFKSKLSDDVKMVAITHVSAQAGMINPIIEIGELLSNHSAFFLVDACQSVGQMPVDVEEIGCDALTATGRKWLRGPRGTGFLYLRKKWITKIEPIIIDLAGADLINPGKMLKDTQLDIRKDIKRFELWERSFAVMLGLGESIKYAKNIGMMNIHNAVSQNALFLRKELSKFKNIQVEEDIYSLSGIVTMTSKKYDVSKIKNQLFNNGINTSVLHDWDGPLDFFNRNLKTALRISPHYYNTKEELITFINKLGEILDNGDVVINNE